MVNELEDLLVDGKTLDRKLVAEILSPYLKIDKESAEIRPLDTWNSLKAAVKILLYLLARKAMVALGIVSAENEPASSTEIMKCSGLKKGTVNPELRRLYEAKTIAQQGKKYFIPNYAMGKIKEIIGNH